MTAAFWSGRRVFLTGHTGFKGGWLTRWLAHLGARVTGYALPPATTPSLCEVAAVERVCVSHRGDVRDAAALRAALADARPEVVFHLAAQPLVLPSYEAPADTYDTNVMGTVHLLEAVRRTPGVRAVVVVTSDKCYAWRADGAPCREEDPLGGHDPYSSSKACAELVTDAFRSSFFPPAAHDRHGVAVATARAGNVLGGGDWSPHRLIPDLLGAFARGETAVLRHPDAVRPWQHVLEPLAGYLRLAERLAIEGPAWGTAWNFGPPEEEMVPVRQVAERLAAHWGAQARWGAFPSPAAPAEAPQLRLDSRRAVHRLGWSPRWGLDEALAQTVAWERARLAGAAMDQVTLRQLVRYATVHPDALAS